MKQPAEFHTKERVLMVGLCTFLALYTAAWGATDERNSGLAIIPAPQSVDLHSGDLLLNGRIVVEAPELKALLPLLEEEIKQLTGGAFEEGQEASEEGVLLLRLDPALQDECYTLEISDQAVVTGGNYAAVAFGTVSLLQVLTSGQDGVTAPRLTITDKPVAAWRGLMIDVARKWHSLDNLKQMVTLCRWYKIRQLQLHFTDKQSFTFPSTAYPKLATPDRHYTVEQLKELEAYAQERGVIIVPELEMPGHSSQFLNTMPELFANEPFGGDVICAGREDVYEALDALIGEMTDIFQTSPWFHIGADEVNMKPWAKCRHCLRYRKKHNLEDIHEQYRHFIVRMNETVKKRGKTTIVWEGFRREGKLEVPRDILVMNFEGGIYYRPDHQVEDGYTIINTSWKPLYVVSHRPAPIGQWTVEYTYGWNMFRWEHWLDRAPAYKNPIQLPDTASVLGAQMCSWLQPEEIELPTIRRRLAAMSERVWNPDAGRSFADFEKRLAVTDAGLSKLTSSN